MTTINCVVCSTPFDEVDEKTGGRYYLCRDCREAEERKEQAVATGQIPEFKDFEEMQKWLKDQETSPTKPKAKKKATTSKPPEEKVKGGEDKNPALVWQAIHVYVRAGDTFKSACDDAKFAKTRVNEANTVVFAHDHAFRQTCSDHCKEI